MALKIDLTGSMVLLTKNRISAICKPLIDFNIPYFQYMRRHKDGSRIIFCNSPQIMQYFYEECHYPFAWYDNDKPIFIYRSGVEFYPIRYLQSTEQEKTISGDLDKFFNVRHSLTYLQKQEEFLDIYHFLSNDSSIYKLSQKIFRHFIFYFREQARLLLQIPEAERIKIPIQQDIKPEEWSKPENKFLKSTDINRYYLDGALDKQYLTKREKECLNWCIEGKTAQEISLILGISIKTAENHIQKAKEKLNCFKQSRLSVIAIKQGIYPI